MYFKYAKVNWNKFSPSDIHFKSNILTKGLEDEIDIVSYKNKGDFYQEYDKGVFVKLNNTKNDYPNAEINIYDRTPLRNRSNQTRLAYQSHFDNLVYLYSTHQQSQYGRDSNGNWVTTPIGNPKSNEEGYAIEFHNFGAEDPRVCQEQIDIIYEVRNFLATRILELKQEKVLTMVA
jgi:hypothetical protein